MIASFIVQTDEEQPPRRVFKMIDGVIAAWDGIFKWKGDLIQAVVADAHVPDELQNVDNMLLIRFGGQHDHYKVGQQCESC